MTEDGGFGEILGGEREEKEMEMLGGLALEGRDLAYHVQIRFSPSPSDLSNASTHSNL